MRNISKLCILMVTMAVLSSCNDRLDGDEIISTDPLKIDSVKIAQDTMDVFSTQTIKTYADFTSQCEGFYGYDYVHKSPLVREVATYKFKTAASCGDVVARASQINFRPQETGTYTFRFWTGKDASNQDTWLERQIVVQ